VELKWYIVHTYSGFENRVKLALEEKIKSLGKRGIFRSNSSTYRKGCRIGKGKEKDFFPKILSRLHNDTNGFD